LDISFFEFIIFSGLRLILLILNNETSHEQMNKFLNLCSAIIF